MDLRIKHNLKPQDFARIKGNLPNVLRAIGIYAKTRWEARGVSDYMHTGAGIKPNQLGIRSGRLVRGFTGKSDGETRITISASGVMSLLKEITVPYAAIHEYGGTVRVRITPKMRKFFWAQYYQTNVAKWRNMALTTKTELTIKIAKRAFAEPSLLDELDNIERHATEQIYELMTAL